MYLFLLGQDIHEMEIGLSNDRELLFCSTFQVPPEEHLKTLDEFLQKCEAAKDELERIYVVTGPGSFTASRVSITIANALAYSHNLPVFEIQNTDKQSLPNLISEVLESNLEPRNFAQPYYDRPAQITKPKS